MRFMNLPAHVSKLDVAKAVREIAIALKESRTMAEISDAVRDTVPDPQFHVSANAIKQFTTKPLRPRLNENNAIVPSLFEFIIRSWSSLPDGARDVAVAQFSAIPGLNYVGRYVPDDLLERVFKLNEATRTWLGIPREQIIDFGGKCHGQFHLFRKSTEKSYIIVKSKLIVETHPEGPAVVGIHISHDQDGRRRLSCGFLMPVQASIYGTLSPFEPKFADCIEHVTLNYDHLILESSFGFIETTESISRNVPLSARVYMIRATQETEYYDYRIDTKENKYKDDTFITKVISFIDSEKARKIRS